MGTRGQGRTTLGRQVFATIKHLIVQEGAERERGLGRFQELGQHLARYARSMDGFWRRLS